MKQIGTYTRVKIAFIVIGIAVMSALGGATFAHTHDMTATTFVLLATAVGLAVFGRRTLRWWWGEVMLGLDDPFGEPSAEYEGTTRTRKLAPKLLRMVKNADGPITVIVTGVELPPNDGTPDAWGEALRSAAQAGAGICQYLPPATTEEEAMVAQTLADEYPHCRCITITETANGPIEMYYPTLAWEGDLKDPRQALLWLEAAREFDETETSVEFRNTRNLQRNAGILEEFVRSVEAAAKRGSRHEASRAAAR